MVDQEPGIVVNELPEALPEEGEKAKDVLELAKKFVENSHSAEKAKNVNGYTLTKEEALSIFHSPDRHIYEKVKAAEKILNEFDKEEDDNLPF